MKCELVNDLLMSVMLVEPLALDLGMDEMLKLLQIREKVSAQRHTNTDCTEIKQAPGVLATPANAASRCLPLKGDTFLTMTKVPLKVL